jgi:hypothetical protein
MKIALCMSGHARTYVRTFEFWRDNLLLHHDVDVFFHLWDTVGPREMGGGLDGKSGVERSSLIDVEHITSLWQPKKIAVEQYMYFHSVFESRSRKWYHTRNGLGLRTIDRPLANMSMYYKWRACNDMKNQYMIANNVSYDMVIRSRPDIALRSPLPEECFTDQSYTYTPRNGSWGYDEISDYMVIGTNKQLDHWCKIYDQIDEKYENALHDGDFTKALYPHKLFYYHFVEHDQPFKQLDIHCDIIR